MFPIHTADSKYTARDCHAMATRVEANVACRVTVASSEFMFLSRVAWRSHTVCNVRLTWKVLQDWLEKYCKTDLKSIAQKTQNICITFVQRRPNVFDVGPTLYKCYTNVLCLPGYGLAWQEHLGHYTGYSRCGPTSTWRQRHLAVAPWSLWLCRMSMTTGLYSMTTATSPPYPRTLLKILLSSMSMWVLMGLNPHIY